MSGFKEFQDYANFVTMSEEELKLVVNYICGHLNSYSSSYQYWYDMYCYCSKSFIVLRWRRKNGLIPCAKLGEAICEDKSINFVKTEHKCSCSSVYFNAVF